jgi:hypothetical protein
MRFLEIVTDAARNSCMTKGARDVMRAWLGPAAKLAELDLAVGDVVNDSR